jgi:hypothetical protein
MIDTRAQRASEVIGRADRRGAVIAATLYVKLPRLAGRWRLRQTRWHLWDVDALPMTSDLDSPIDRGRLGPALCGREGTAAVVHGSEATELLVLETSFYRNHGGCDRCLSIHRMRANDHLAGHGKLL